MVLTEGDIYVEKFTLNPDPKKRLIAIFEVSQNSSIASKAMYEFMTLEHLKKEFKDSPALEEFYAEPHFQSWCMVICLYHTANDKEVRRRLVKTQMPEDSDGLFKIMEMAADSVGVKVNFHQNKVQAYEKEIVEATVSVKEREIFLHTLIDLFHGEISDKPFDQLRQIKENFLRNAALLGTDNSGHIIGGFLQHYIETKDNVYRVAKHFGEQLLKANLKLSSEYIPTLMEPYLLELPFAFKFQDFYIKNVIVDVNLLSEDFSKGVTLICPKYSNGQWDSDLFVTTINCESSADIDESLKDTSKFFYDKEVVSLSDIKVYKELVSFCLKSIIYIHSSESDIRSEKGVESKKKNPEKLKTFYKHNNPFTVINVGFSFHGRVYSMSETSVSGHFRWQPCGQGFSQVKLIWIEEHLRQYSDVMGNKLTTMLVND